MDALVSAEMTRVSNVVFAGVGDDVYDAMMDGTGRLLDLVGVEHGGDAYVLWSELCDRWETAPDPDAVAAASAAAREVAAEWLAIDHASDPEVSAFFHRRLVADDDV